MRILANELENRMVDHHKLLEYGFILRTDVISYEDFILDNQFKIIINYDQKKMTSKVVDVTVNEEYLLVDVIGASGEFVGRIKEQYENRLKDMIKCCTTPCFFKSEQALLVIEYVKNKYQNELEYLWPKFSKNAIWRHQDNQKWYGALLVIEESKLGMDSNQVIDIIDLRAPTQFIENHVDHRNIFPGYHMNKQHWLTIKLDGTVPIEEIYKYIDESYQMK